MKIIKTCIFALCAVWLVACNNKSKEAEQVLATDSLETSNVKVDTIQSLKNETPAMSGWKCYGLYGKVKLVKYPNGNSLTFNTDGNLTKKTTVYEEYGEYTQTRKYESPTKYTQDDLQYEITYKGNVRTEKRPNDNPEDMYTAFHFDKQGRLAKYEISEMSINEELYKYASDTDPFPVSYTFDGGDETGSYTTICTYEYLKTDSHGNWTERTVNEKRHIEDELGKKSLKVSTIKEKREITYY